MDSSELNGTSTSKKTRRTGLVRLTLSPKSISDSQDDLIAENYDRYGELDSVEKGVINHAASVPRSLGDISLEDKEPSSKRRGNSREITGRRKDTVTSRLSFVVGTAGDDDLDYGTKHDFHDQHSHTFLDQDEEEGLLIEEEEEEDTLYVDPQ